LQRPGWESIEKNRGKTERENGPKKAVKRTTGKKRRLKSSRERGNREKRNLTLTEGLGEKFETNVKAKTDIPKQG